MESRQLDETWEVSRQADPYHLAATQQRKARQAEFSPDMIPALTKAARGRALRALSKDISARCSLIIEKLTKLGDGKLENTMSYLPSVRAATIECYAGNCSYCAENALVCSGTAEGCWWVTSAFLPTHNITFLKMTENDKSVLHSILEMRLSEAAIYKVSSGTSTQKAEAFNRAAAATMRKDVNLSRNFSGRLASQALKANNTLSTAMASKIEYVTKNRSV